MRPRDAVRGLIGVLNRELRSIRVWSDVETIQANENDVRKAIQTRERKSCPPAW